VPLQYLLPTTSGALRQGEIISEVWEHQPSHSPVELPEGSAIGVHSELHPHLLVMTADCDLLWDYQPRLALRDKGESVQSARDHPSLLPHVLFCEIYDEVEIKGRVLGSDLWKRIRQNQDERYHHLSASAVGDPTVSDLPDLYLDFKKTLTLPTHRLYEALESSRIRRSAVLPPVFLQALMHRFYSFLGRVGVPES